jgi:hypothetical protein
MTVISKLAISLGRRDEVPNQELARDIAAAKDKAAIKELIENLKHKDKNIQSDCIKVLYEIGEQQPDLIAIYDKEFFGLLSNKNNRLVWGAMSALDCIASVNPDGIYKNLAIILDTADKGTVITKDHAVSILIKLAANKIYTDHALNLLFGMLKTCATNQLPMYAENAMPVVTHPFKIYFIEILASRLDEIEKETKRKRVEKVIKKMSEL